MTEDELLEPRARASCTSTTGRGCGCSSGATPSTASPRCCSSCRATTTTPTWRRGPARSWPQAYGGRVSASYPSFSDAPLARVHYIIGFTPGAARRAGPARRWRRHRRGGAHLGGPVRGRGPRRRPQRRTRWPTSSPRYGDAFPAGYRDRFDAAEALADLAVIDGMAPGQPMRVRAYRTPATARLQFRFKLYRPGRAGAAGRRPADPREHGPEGAGRGRLRRSAAPARPPVWVHDFEIEDPRGERPGLRRRQAAPSRTPWSRSGPAAPRTTASTAWCWSSSIPWREAALVRASPATASSRASTPASGCRRRRCPTTPRSPG